MTFATRRPGWRNRLGKRGIAWLAPSRYLLRATKAHAGTHVRSRARRPAVSTPPGPTASRASSGPGSSAKLCTGSGAAGQCAALGGRTPRSGEPPAASMQVVADGDGPHAGSRRRRPRGLSCARAPTHASSGLRCWCRAAMRTSSRVISLTFGAYISFILCGGLHHSSMRGGLLLTIERGSVGCVGVGLLGIRSAAPVSKREGRLGRKRTATRPRGRSDVLHAGRRAPRALGLDWGTLATGKTLLQLPCRDQVTCAGLRFDEAAQRNGWHSLARGRCHRHAPAPERAPRPNPTDRWGPPYPDIGVSPTVRGMGAEPTRSRRSAGLKVQLSPQPA